MKTNRAVPHASLFLNRPDLYFSKFYFNTTCVISWWILYGVVLVHVVFTCFAFERFVFVQFVFELYAIGLFVSEFLISWFFPRVCIT